MLQDFFIGFNNLITQQYFGTDVWRIVVFFGILMAFVLIGKIVYFFIKNYVKKVTNKTKTKLDDVFVSVIEGPIIFFLFIVGLFTGFQFLAITNPAILSVFNNILGMLIVLNISWVALRLVDNLVEIYLIPLTKKTDSKLDDQLIPIARKVSKLSIILVAGIIIMSNFGYDVTALIAGLGIGGLAFALAAQNTISNVFGGITIFVDKPFTIHDAIKFGDIEGEVVSVGLRTTRVKDWDKRIITIPNEKISGNIIKNISSEPSRKKVITLGLTYDTSSKKLQIAIKIVKKILENHSGVEDLFFVRFMDFSASSLDIKVIYYISDLSRKFDVMHEINMQILEEFNKAKLDFAFPTQTVHVKKS